MRTKLKEWQRRRKFEQGYGIGETKEEVKADITAIR